MEGRFNGRFFALPVWGLIFGGAYTWTSLFSEFYGILVVGKDMLQGYNNWGTFLCVFTVVPREIEDINAYPKFWGAKKVYYRRCASGRFMKEIAKAQDYMC